ncbi:MAG: S8 family serine peptidase [Bacteroidales bacterium]|nr:S8 family serine peptidase [Bacteroidales bacterium]
MRTILILLCLLLSVNLLTGQEYQPGKLWVSITSEESRAVDDSSTAHPDINAVFRNFNVTSYRQLMGFARTPHLTTIYEISCDCDQVDLMQALSSMITEYFGFIEQVDLPINLYNPEDGAWGNRHDSWHLRKIQADSAWEITIGQPWVRVGVIDNPPDVTHPDLEGQIFPHYNPLKGNEYGALYGGQFKAWHGTPVASFIAAATAEEGDPNMTPNGYLASIGFKTKLIAYGPQDLASAVHASTKMGVDIISISWFYVRCYPPSDTIYQIELESIQEILNNGTVIVVAAGNGCMGSCYNDETLMYKRCDDFPPDFQYYSPTYPFHPGYDSNIIIVTSTDSLDYHYQINPVNNHDITHSHFSAVDICSPGYDISGATNTMEKDTLGNIFPNPWPYYWKFGGTSFATPIVSGLCALIKSINPCLTAAEIEYILKQTADPVQDEQNYSGLLGAGRINAYKAVKYAEDNYGYEEYFIGTNDDITWTTEMQAKKIVVDSAGRLTIKSTVIMLPGSDIVVLRGGNLVVDSGHITTCKGLWNGIQVSGKRDLDQYSFYNQGHLSLINGAIIENAMVGVQLAANGPSGIDPTTTGGILRAENASFINCVTSVAFYPYENFLNDKKNIRDNVSYMNYCNFILNSDYNHVFFSPMRFVYLEDVRGISFKGCSFLNQIKSSDYASATGIDPDRMIGIMSLDAAFKVDEFCLNPVYPCDTSAPSRFENLSYGIYTMNYGGKKHPRIERSEFIRNKTSIYLGAIENAVVFSNYFSVRKPHDDIFYGHSDLNFTGVYCDHSTGYIIEENSFESNYPGPYYTPKTTGVIINSSGPHPNEIYKNSFNQIRYGIIAMNQNKRDSVGLCIKCNNFSNCRYDIAVVVEDSVSGWGIAEHQGSREDVTTAPAGNVFSEWIYHDFDLFNDDNADPFTYFHHNEDYTPAINVEPDPDKCSPSVSLVLNDQRYDPDESCPSRQGGGGNPSIERNAFDDSQAQVIMAEASLAALVDGGDTESLTMDVVTSTPPSAADLTLQLLNESPYLSDTVMKSAVLKEDVLSNAMIRDILVENPQSAKSADIMQLLDERVNPMPQYMKDQVEQGKFTTGNKENLEAKRSFYLVEMERAFNNLSRYYLSDSAVTYRMDSLAALFGELNTLENRYRSVFIHLENGDTTLANNTLNGIPNAFALTVEQSNTHQKYEDLLNILIGLSVSNGTVMNLDSARIAGLLDTYDNTTLPGIYARNMLVTAGYLAYQEPYLFPDNLKTMVVKPVSTDHPSHSVRLIAFPNPAAYYTIIGFYASNEDNWREGKSGVTIHVRDVRGIRLRMLTSDTWQDQLVLDVRNLKPGMYFIELLINGKRKATAKLIVNR